MPQEKSELKDAINLVLNESLEQLNQKYISDSNETSNDERKTKTHFKKELRGLINVSGLYSYLNEDSWYPIGIVEVEEPTDIIPKISFKDKNRVRVINEKENLIYARFDLEDQQIRKVDHYYVWQTVGYWGDDYSGFMLFPLNDGRYFKVSFSC
jgi:hypothetical protein